VFCSEIRLMFFSIAAVTWYQKVAFSGASGAHEAAGP
jgi:hypothetical protein